jgi:O-antigen ligase
MSRLHNSSTQSHNLKNSRPLNLTSYATPAPLAKKLATFLVIAFGFVLPLSISATNILLPFLILMGLWQWRVISEQIKHHQALIFTGFALLAWILISTLLSAHHSLNLLAQLNHYRELILLVFFLTLLCVAGNSQLALIAFVIGSLVLCGEQWGTFVSDRLAASMEAKRITNGFLLACAAYVAAWLAILDKHNPKLRITWALLSLFIIATTVLAVRGRTGHLTIVALIAVFAWQFAKPRWRIVLALALVLCIGLLALFAKPVQQRLTEQSTELQNYSSGKNIVTSTGARIEFVRNTWEMIKLDGILGIGYGEFEARYKLFAHARYLDNPALKQFAEAQPLYPAHPHNEFLYHWICGGVVALLLFTAWLTLPIVNAIRRPGLATTGAATIALAMIIGCLFNAFLLNLPEGHAYIFLLAAFLSFNTTTNTSSA